MRKIKLTRANKSILLKALAPYYYQQRALGHSTEKPGRLILKINFLPAAPYRKNSTGIFSSKALSKVSFELYHIKQHLANIAAEYPRNIS